jgi:hypothetical protein
MGRVVWWKEDTKGLGGGKQSWEGASYAPVEFRFSRLSLPFISGQKPGHWKECGQRSPAKKPLAGVFNAPCIPQV